jgi:hypothetical protein
LSNRATEVLPSHRAISSVSGDEFSTLWAIVLRKFCSHHSPILPYFHTLLHHYYGTTEDNEVPLHMLHKRYQHKNRVHNTLSLICVFQQHLHLQFYYLNMQFPVSLSAVSLSAGSYLSNTLRNCFVLSS